MDTNNPQPQDKDLHGAGAQEVNKYSGHTSDGRVPVIEIFGPTIQGEGGMIGEKTMFVRMGGCDYRCAKCDSLHAVIPQAVKKHAKWMTYEEILIPLYEAKVRTGVEWVTLSGGNPAMWDLFPLVAMLKALGMKVAVETQGTIWRDWLAEVSYLTICPKGPGMGEKFIPEVFTKFLSHVEESYQRMMGHLGVGIKAVVFDQQDLEFAVCLDQILDGRGESPAVDLNITEEFEDKFPTFIRQANRFWPRKDRFLSLGNPYPPKLDPETLNLREDTAVFQGVDQLQDILLKDYRNLLEMDYLNDPRLAHWKFLPQLHVLIWANKAGV